MPIGLTCLISWRGYRLHMAPLIRQVRLMGILAGPSKLYIISTYIDYMDGMVL